jgi:hypothetical protein
MAETLPILALKLPTSPAKETAAIVRASQRLKGPCDRRHIVVRFLLQSENPNW